jgi:hypothetical protein
MQRCAAECLRVATKVKNLKTKAALLDMVAAWLFLAELADKNKARHEAEQHSTRPN